MNDFESAVAKAHNELVAAGHSWAQPQAVSMAELADAEKLPHEWIRKPMEHPTAHGRRVVVLMPAV